MQDYQQKESMAMLRLQESLQPSLETDPSSDTDSLGDKLPHSAPKKKHLFKLPRRLRDRLYLTRAEIDFKEHINVLQNTDESFDFKKIRKARNTQFSLRVLKDYDSTERVLLIYEETVKL